MKRLIFEEKTFEVDPIRIVRDAPPRYRSLSTAVAEPWTPAYRI